MLPLEQFAATQLRAEMGKARLTQKALAQALNISSRKAADLMSGDSPWQLADLAAVARLFRVQPIALIPDDTDCDSGVKL